MDQFQQQGGQTLERALRLAAMSKTPHGVARVVLLYHQTLYMTVQAFTPCDACLDRDISLEQVKCHAAQLDEQRVYYAVHVEQFGKSELQTMIRNTLLQLDLSSLCASCLERFQHQLTTTFTERLAKRRIVYRFRTKKR